MIKNFEQFKTYFYLYLVVKDCDEQEEELFFDLDYLRRKLNLYLMCNPVITTNDNVINNIEDLCKHFIIYGKIN